ncbi:MAG: outer membrane lipoprotein chaperone LolA [Bdellovibrionales bacterium]|nr:outer membrane lipoprotein chaperone LolA [Ramlibacter sp.]
MSKTNTFFIAALLLSAAAQSAFADGLGSLEAFVKNTRSGRADFTQVVTAPAREGQVSRTKTSSGTFEFLRPNRFRFFYKKPFEQTIVADGQTLWLHDVDLNQVTARKQAQVLGSTPAALVASAPDLKALQADFNLQSSPEKDGMQWAVATPKSKDAQLQSVRIGFKGNELAALEILDSFGQRSLMSFSKVEVNPSLAAEAFNFKPPAGADVIRQ